MNDMRELIDRCNRMAYWLGFMYSSMGALLNDPTVLECQKDTVRGIIDIVNPALEDIFYPKQE